MQHSGAADGRVSSTVSQDPCACEHKSGSVGAVVQTAGAGAEGAATTWTGVLNAA
jgi:hypothetical protein